MTDIVGVQIIRLPHGEGLAVSDKGARMPERFPQKWQRVRQ